MWLRNDETNRYEYTHYFIDFMPCQLLEWRWRRERKLVCQRNVLLWTSVFT